MYLAQSRTLRSVSGGRAPGFRHAWRAHVAWQVAAGIDFCRRNQDGRSQPQHRYFVMTRESSSRRVQQIQLASIHAPVEIAKLSHATQTEPPNLLIWIRSGDSDLRYLKPCSSIIAFLSFSIFLSLFFHFHKTTDLLSKQNPQNKLHKLV